MITGRGQDSPVNRKRRSRGRSQPRVPSRTPCAEPKQLKAQDVETDRCDPAQPHQGALTGRVRRVEASEVSVDHHRWHHRPVQHAQLHHRERDRHAKPDRAESSRVAGREVEHLIVEPTERACRGQRPCRGPGRSWSWLSSPATTDLNANDRVCAFRTAQSYQTQSEPRSELPLSFILYSNGGTRAGKEGHWSEAMDATLREIHDPTVRGRSREIADRLRVLRWAVNRCAAPLGLSRPKDRRGRSPTRPTSRRTTTVARCARSLGGSAAHRRR